MKDLYFDFRQQKIINQFGLALLFLFPVGATYIRHWLSYIFVLLFFFSIYYLFKEKNTTQKLGKEEKILIAIFVSYFAVFMISALLNHWGKEQTYAFGLEIRFLVIIPVYLLIRKIPNALDYLLIGSALGVVGSFVESIYEIAMQDVRYLNDGNIKGIYGHLFIGPITTLFMFSTCALLVKNNLSNMKFVFIVVILGVVVIYTSQARSSWLAFVIILPIVLLMIFSLAKVKVYILFYTVFLAVILYSNNSISNKLNEGVGELKRYYSQQHYLIQKNNYFNFGSIGMRLEVYRAGIFCFKRYPLFGIGQGNFQREVKQLIEEEKVHRATVIMPHMHNAFLEMLVNRGIIGFMVTIMLYFYPLYIFVKGLRIDRKAAIAGILFVTCMTIFSLTDSSPLIKNNYVAIFLVFLVTIFSTVIKSKQESEKLLNA